MVLAMGLVFVLLLGEIDLSAGFTAGTGAAILGVTLTEHGWAWPLSVLAALRHRRGHRLRDRAAGGAAGHPVVRRLAGLLPRPAGRDAVDHRRGRDDPDPQRGDPRDHEQEHAGRRSAGCSRSIVIGGFAAATFWAIRTPQAGRAADAGDVGVGGEGRRARGGRARSRCTCSTRSASARTRRSSSRACRGWCRWSTALVVVLTFLLMRTGFGRHVYAVGGNAEAARRAGIDVANIKTVVLHPLLDAGGRRGHPARRRVTTPSRRPPAARRRCCTRSARR